MKLTVLILALSGLMLAGCAPEVGSKKWCAQLKNKDKGDWTVNEAKDFAQHCLFK